MSTPRVQVGKAVAPGFPAFVCARPSAHRRSPLNGPGCTALALCAALAGSLLAVAPATAQTRGALLYNTHCISCHTMDMHWRDKRAANDWPGLQALVRRWQDASSLSWSESDILDVSRHLNDTIYRFERPVDAASAPKPMGHGPVYSRTAPLRERGLLQGPQ